MKMKSKKTGNFLTPKPDNSNCKTPCSKCLGNLCVCLIAAKRVPSKECKTYVEIGTTRITYADGTEEVI